MYLCTHVHPTALLKPSCSTKSPEEGRPKPQEVGQVIHGDQEPSPPSHLIWPNHWKPEAANPLDEFQKLSEEENQQEEEDLDVQGIHWRGWIRLFLHRVCGQRGPTNKQECRENKQNDLED